MPSANVASDKEDVGVGLGDGLGAGVGVTVEDFEEEPHPVRQERVRVDTHTKEMANAMVDFFIGLLAVTADELISCQ
ncbi:hypothetical protein MHM98_07580 [Psychrobium sp. MM17-31]|uniref:hypothetical protein n=1 Tax=Psychrobium sp. MM17-31 TaxID=2917758 RepID=UPI001EF550F5|nr:hypothetical protein [Psychrobium sp. MM17-31]MCG7531212.1 hypothetical protein [Psychrobium sp. MM17-31]